MFRVYVGGGGTRKSKGIFVNIDWYWKKLEGDEKDHEHRKCH